MHIQVGSAAVATVDFALGLGITYGRPNMLRPLRSACMALLLSGSCAFAPPVDSPNPVGSSPRRERGKLG